MASFGELCDLGLVTGRTDGVAGPPEGAQSLATRHEREHRRSPAPVRPRGHRPLDPTPARSRQDRPWAQRQALQDAQMGAAIGAVGRSDASTPGIRHAGVAHSTTIVIKIW